MKYFRLEEFAVSSSYPKLVELPKGSIEQNVKLLVEVLLDPIREKIGMPITVTSGYRPKKLNDAVGGAKNSNHLYGYAADVQCGNKRSDNLKIVYALLELGCDWDECIIEKGTLTAPQWIHIAFKRTGNRRRLEFYNGKTYRAVTATKQVTWKLK